MVRKVTSNFVVKFYYQTGKGVFYSTTDDRFNVKFQTWESKLDWPRKAICHLSEEDPLHGADIIYGSATSFFIGPKILLMAGHVISKENSQGFKIP